MENSAIHSERLIHGQYSSRPLRSTDAARTQADGKSTPLYAEGLRGAAATVAGGCDCLQAAAQHKIKTKKKRNNPHSGRLRALSLLFNRKRKKLDNFQAFEGDCFEGFRLFSSSSFPSRFILLVGTRRPLSTATVS